MEIEGRIILDLPLQTGTSKAGKPWKKKEWVLETFGSYPRKVKFHIFGDRVDTIRLEPGKDYVLSFDLESREFNGKWYTDVSVYQARDYVPQGYPQGAPAASPGYGMESQPSYGAASQDGYAAPGAAPFGAAPQPTFSQPGGAEEDLPF